MTTKPKATAILLALSQATFASQVTSSADHRVSVAVTVYNDGRGLIRALEGKSG